VEQVNYERDKNKSARQERVEEAGPRPSEPKDVTEWMKLSSSPTSKGRSWGKLLEGWQPQFVEEDLPQTKVASKDNIPWALAVIQHRPALLLYCKFAAPSYAYAFDYYESES